MPDDLVGLLERADLALGSCAGVLDETELASVIEAVRAVRTRTAYPDDVLVVAFAGGTGSGKSSLFNALTGEDLVDVGGVRPTTSHPAAAVPSHSGASLDGYLDRLGIDERHVYDGSGLCLLDLADTDSVHVDHRHQVDALLPVVDVVVWVTDPEKYRDSRLHDEYLGPMAAYSAQFVLVLNQIDRLAEEEVEDVCNDLESALEENWLDEAVIIPAAAAPPSGPPIGLDELRLALEDKRADRHTLHAKLLTDLAAASRALSRRVGSGLDFDTRADRAVRQAAGALASGRMQTAEDALTGFLDDLAAETGAITSQKLRAVAADVPDHIRRIEGQLPAETPSRSRWWRRGARAAEPIDQSDVAVALLAEAVIRPARAIVARRALAVAAVSEFALEVESLRNRPAR